MRRLAAFLAAFLATLAVALVPLAASDLSRPGGQYAAEARQPPAARPPAAIIGGARRGSGGARRGAKGRRGMGTLLTAIGPAAEAA